MKAKRCDAAATPPPRRRRRDARRDLRDAAASRAADLRAGRSWVLDFFSLEGWAIVLALVPALIILVLFIFDHNVSSIMAQGAEFKLKKGSAYVRRADISPMRRGAAAAATWIVRRAATPRRRRG